MAAETIEVEIHTEWIPLDKLLKFAGVAESGGQAGEWIADGAITLNGAVVQEKRKKIRPGDVVRLGDEIILNIKREETL